MTEQHLSHSQVSTYLSCGEKYRLQYVEQQPRVPQGPFIGGIAVHETIEEATNTGRWADSDAFQEPSGAMVIWFRERLLQLVDEAGGPQAVRWGGRKSKTFPDGEDLEWWFRFGPGMLNRFHQVKLADEEQGWEVGAAEIAVSFTLDSGTNVKARIDELLLHSDGGVKVRDWKTGQARPEERIQLGLYAHACQVTLGLVPTVGELHYLRSATAKVESFEPGPWLDTVLLWLQRAEEGIRQGVYLLRPSSYCVSCQVQDGCPYWQRLQEEGSVEVAAEGSTVDV